MQKMTVMALPKYVVDSMGGRSVAGETAAGRFWNGLQNILAYKGELFFYGIAFFLGRLVFLGDLAPFGLGFFAASAQAVQQRSGGVGLAVLLGVLSTGRYEEIGVYLLAMGAYAKLKGRLTRLDRRMYAIPFTMFFAVLSGGWLLHLLRDAPIYDYLATAFNAVLCLLSAELFLYGIPLLRDRQAIAQAYRQAANENLICLVVICALAAAGIGDITLWGCRLQAVVGGILIMALALAGGAGLGAAAGVTVGMVAGLGGAPQAAAGIALYAAGGTIAGVFKSLGKFAVILGFIFGSLILHLSFTQLPLLMQGVAENAAAAAAVALLPLASMLSLRREMPLYGDSVAHRVLEESSAKLQGVAGLLYEISTLLGMRGGETAAKDCPDVARLLSAVGLKVCESCENRPRCWEEKYYQTYQAMLGIFHQMGEKPLRGRDLPMEFREECVQAGKIVEVINEIMEKNRINAYWREKVGAQKQAAGDQTKAVGNIVMQLAQEMDRPSSFDAQWEQSLRKKAAQIGCPIENVVSVGRDWPRCITLEKSACGKNGECVNSLLPLVSGVLQKRLTLTRTCGSAALKTKCRICLQASPVFRVRAAAAFIPKAGAAACGDSVKVTTLQSGKVSLLLSDGMGSGKHAAKESRMTVEYLSKLLARNFDVDAAVKIVNSLLLLESAGEKFATVDMAIVDPYTGEAEFLKIASAPSFIKRVREVRTIQAKALPVGILNQIEIEPVRAQLAARDMVIMVSDGIADLKDMKLRSSDKDGWLVNFIRRSDLQDEKKFAEAILAEALRISDGKAADDMSVLVMLLDEEKLI